MNKSLHHDLLDWFLTYKKKSRGERAGSARQARPAQLSQNIARGVDAGGARGIRLEARRVGAGLRSGALKTKPTAENQGLAKTKAKPVAGFSSPVWQTGQAVASEIEL